MVVRTTSREHFSMVPNTSRILFLTGATHSGKTLLADRLMKRYGIPVLSLDLLKMGLIRSGKTTLTPYDDDELTKELWPIVREMVRTAIENGRSLIVEGGHIPGNWAESFQFEERRHIFAAALVMTPAYIEAHYDDILRHAEAAEGRLGPPPAKGELLAEHAKMADVAVRHGFQVIRIDKDFRPDYRFPR